MVQGVFGPRLVVAFNGDDLLSPGQVPSVKAHVIPNGPAFPFVNVSNAPPLQNSKLIKPTEHKSMAVGIGYK